MVKGEALAMKRPLSPSLIPDEERAARRKRKSDTEKFVDSLRIVVVSFRSDLYGDAVCTCEGGVLTCEEADAIRDGNNSVCEESLS
jgi:hypothetical protein